MRLATKLAAGLGALALTYGVSGIAYAEGNGTSVGDANQFRCHTYDSNLNPTTDGSYCKWQGFTQNGEDSPLDANARALVTDLAPGDFAEAYTNKSLNIDTAASNVKNLSFDIRTADIQAGSPRIVVQFTNPLTDGNNYAFLSASDCNQPISSTWSRADFTGRTAAGCTIRTEGSSERTYTSDGTHSAWDVLLTANPGAVVSYTYMVWDASPTHQTYRTDRISLGTGFLYNYGNGRAIRCTTEASC